MPSSSTLVAFTLAALALVVVPGPNVLYILGSGIGAGRRTAVASALGVEAGTLVHIAGSAVGLAALLRSSPVAFTVLRLLGVAYLVCLAVQAFRSARQASTQTQPAEVPFGWAFRRGLGQRAQSQSLVVLPRVPATQFVDPYAPTAGMQILVLGMVTFAVALGVDLGYTVLSGSVGLWLGRRPRLARRQAQFTGTVYLALATAAVATGGRNA